MGVGCKRVAGVLGVGNGSAGVELLILIFPLYLMDFLGANFGGGGLWVCLRRTAFVLLFTAWETYMGFWGGRAGRPGSLGVFAKGHSLPLPLDTCRIAEALDMERSWILGEGCVD